MWLDIADFHLRPIRLSDCRAIAFHGSHAKVARYMAGPFPHPYTEAAANAWLREIVGQDPVLQFAIAGKGGLIGCIGLDPGEDVRDHEAELGYWLAVPYWGLGIATAAVKTITHYAFTRLGLVRVFAGVFANNCASIRVLEKAGFQMEGSLRKSIYKHGRYWDQWIYGRLRRDLNGTPKLPNREE